MASALVAGAARATVPVKLGLVPETSRAVALPAGRRDVHPAYRPPLLGAGVFVSPPRALSVQGLWERAGSGP